jgi:ankyrin repeat protein
MSKMPKNAKEMEDVDADENDASVGDEAGVGASKKKRRPASASLSTTARRGDARGVARLLSEGSKTRGVFKAGTTPLMHAIESGSEECVALLLTHSDLRARDNEGDNMLLLAARKGSGKILGALVVELKSRMSKDGKALWDELGGVASGQALMEAAERGHAECVRILIEAGADAHYKDNQGATALLRAIKLRKEEVSWLLAPVSDWAAVAENGVTLLMVAADVGDEGWCRRLAEKVDVNRVTKSGETALMFACRSRSAGCASILYKVSDASMSVNGKTALHIAMEKGDGATLRAVQPAKDLWLRNAEGMSSLLLVAQGRIDDEAEASKMAAALVGTNSDIKVLCEWSRARGMAEKSSNHGIARALGQMIDAFVERVELADSSRIEPKIISRPSRTL